MAAVNPSWINGVQLDDARLRRIDSLLTMGNGNALGARSGIVPGSGGFTVTVSGSTITVTSGIAAVYQPGQGVYRAALTSSTTLTLNAADATLPRTDLVYLRIWDNAYDGSGLNQADVVYLAGTPSSTPTAPTPAGTQIYMQLATISVPASGGGSPSVSQSVRPYTVAPGGILPSSSAPSSPYVGQYYDNGTDLLRYNGSGWDTCQKVDSVSWTTPTLASGYTQGDTATNGNLNGPIRYRKVRDHGTDWIEWDGGAQRVAGSQTTNILSAALSSAYRPAARASLVIARNATGINGVSGSGSAVHSVKVDFNQDGTVSLVAAAAGTDETSWFSFRGIRYALS